MNGWIYALHCALCLPSCLCLFMVLQLERSHELLLTLLCAIEEHQCHQSTYTLLTKAGQILEAAVSAFTIDIISHW